MKYKLTIFLEISTGDLKLPLQKFSSCVYINIIEYSCSFPSSSLNRQFFMNRNQMSTHIRTLSIVFRKVVMCFRNTFYGVIKILFHSVKMYRFALTNYIRYAWYHLKIYCSHTKFKSKTQNIITYTKMC